jgi:hypothetical protein
VTARSSSGISPRLSKDVLISSLLMIGPPKDMAFETGSGRWNVSWGIQRTESTRESVEAPTG